MIVCLCHPATERDVDACIRDGARSVEDIGAMCGAGQGCGACQHDLRERLERAGLGGDADRSDPGAPRGCPGAPVSIRSLSTQGA